MKKLITLLFLVTLLLTAGCQKEKEEIYDDSALRGKEYINETVTIKAIYSDVRKNKTFKDEKEVKELVDIISSGETMDCDEPVLYGNYSKMLKLYDKNNKLIDEVTIHVIDFRPYNEARFDFKSDSTCYRLNGVERLKYYLYEE